MDCLSHPGVPAVATCAGCAESYCKSCLVTVGAHEYCASCESMAVSADEFGAVVRCPEAGEALKYSLISILLGPCIPLLAPIGIARAIQAKQAIRANPQLAGDGKANAALIVGIVMLLLWGLAALDFISRSFH